PSLSPYFSKILEITGDANRRRRSMAGRSGVAPRRRRLEGLEVAAQLAVGVAGVAGDELVDDDAPDRLGHPVGDAEVEAAHGVGVGQGGGGEGAVAQG